MKRTLIAISTIAAMGAAFADVTVYGKLDVGVVRNTDNTAGTFNQGLTVASGQYEGSRIGVKGGSDIADGVKGVFQLEGGVSATTGAFTGFGRVASFGLTGSLGTVTAGLQWSPYDSAMNDALEYNGFSALGSAFCSTVHCDLGNTGGGNTKNSIQYTSPTFNGFNVVANAANGGDATITDSASSYVGYGLNYANGPVTVNLATEAVKPVGNGSTTNAWVLATSYNAGVATVYLAVEGADAGAAGKDAGNAFGVSVPVSKQFTVALGQGYSTQSLAGSTDGKIVSTGLQGVYAWNAATAIYVGYRTTATTALNAGVTNTATKLATGVRYNF